MNSAYHFFMLSNKVIKLSEVQHCITHTHTHSLPLSFPFRVVVRILHLWENNSNVITFIIYFPLHINSAMKKEKKYMD